MCINTNGNPEGTSQPKVSQFDNAFVVYQQVLRLQVSMKNSSAVAKDYPLQDLIQITLEGKRQT